MTSRAVRNWPAGRDVSSARDCSFPLLGESATTFGSWCRVISVTELMLYHESQIREGIATVTGFVTAVSLTGAARMLRAVTGAWKLLLNVLLKGDDGGPDQWGEMRGRYALGRSRSLMTKLMTNCQVAGNGSGYWGLHDGRSRYENDVGLALWMEPSSS